MRSPQAGGHAGLDIGHAAGRDLDLGAVLVVARRTADLDRTGRAVDAQVSVVGELGADTIGNADIDRTGEAEQAGAVDVERATAWLGPVATFALLVGLRIGHRPTGAGAE